MCCARRRLPSGDGSYVKDESALNIVMMMDLPNLSVEQFNRFREFIYKTSGIKVDEKKISMLSHRIRGRLSAGEFDCFDAYYRHVTSFAGKDELEYFLDAVTTNETYFFRSGAHFEWFKRDFINERLLAKKESSGRTIRVWSAACSTGEEAYSLAICFAENSLRLRDWTIEIVGTDISEAVLKRAREGEYKQRSLDEVDDTRLRRWFKANTTGDAWTVRKDVRSPVRFVLHNLIEPIKEKPFDCIFIRNVLIYFDRESKKKVIKHLMSALAPGGYLVVGPSEGIYDMLEPLEKKMTFLYQKPIAD